MQADVVVEGIRFGEGPVWCPPGSDRERQPASLAVTSVCDGKLFRVFPDEHRYQAIADTGGGPNGLARGTDGTLVVTQNGGIDFAAMGVFPDAAYRPVTPGLQVVSAAGKVSYLADVGFQAPNDLVVAPDGVVYFTDPPPFPPPKQPLGRVWAYEPDGNVSVVAGGFLYCNGIALDRERDLVVVEGRGLQRLNRDGEREWIVEELGPGGGDGFCLDTDGNFYVAATVDHGVRVISPDGRELDFLEIEGEGVTTNCCFGGADNRTLFATDAVPGRIVAWEALPTPGLPLPPWPAD
ncbi:MAG TPA: SMP-30/gluconolactonase/LRE family protein [Acidimicrobiia bacterium]